MIAAAIFDLDGLLVDSEPLWRQAEIEILRPLGVPLTDPMCKKTQGTRVDRAVSHWFERFPWQGPTVGQVVERVVERVVELVTASVRPMPGAVEAVEFFQSRRLPVAVCSSSWSTLIDAALARVGLESITVRQSAEDEDYGKPHPACYLTAAAKLGVEPQHCVALEDSLNGAIAAKAALMTVIAVPEPGLASPTQWGFCDAVLGSLEEVDGALLDRLGRS